MDRGRNSGVTGIVDLGELAPKFTARCYGFQESLSINLLDASGRGDGLFPEQRPITAAGTLVVSGKVQLAGYPRPNAWKGEKGSIRLQLHTGVTETVSVRVIGYSATQSEKDQDLWTVQLTCQIRTDPTLAGFTGTQATAATELLSDKELWANLTKSIDPKSLQDSATQRFLLWAVSDDDTAEVVRIQEMIGAALTPVLGLKLRATTFSRVGKDGCYLDFTWARRNTQDDVEQGETTYRIDPSLLTDEVRITRVELDATPDGGITVPGLVLRDTEKNQLHDTRWAITYIFGQTTHQQDVEFDGTFTVDDPRDLLDSAAIRLVNSSSTPPASLSTPPSGLKLRNLRSQQSTDAGKWVHSAEYGRTDSEDDATYPKIHTTDDANNIADEAVRAQVWDTAGSAPALPTDAPTNNVKLIAFTDAPLTPFKKARVWLYGPKNSADELILPNYETTTDASALDSTAIRAYLDGDSVPSTPSGMVLRDTKVRPVTLGLGVNRTLTILIFGTRTRQEDIEFLESKAVTETGQIDREPVIVKVNSSSTPPDFDALNPDSTNLSVYSIVSRQHTDAGKWVHACQYAPLASLEKDTAERQHDETDPALLDEESTRVLYGPTSTPSADPGVSGKVLFKTDSRRVGKAKYRYVYTYRWRTTAQAEEAQRTRTTTDLSALESQATTADVWKITDGAPADPTLSGFVLIDKSDEETPNPAYRLRVYRWGLVTNQQRIEFGETDASADPMGINERSTASVVAHSGTAAELADSLLASNQSDPLFAGVKVKKITPDKALQIIRQAGGNLNLHSGSAHSVREAVRGIPFGALIGPIATNGAVTGWQELRPGAISTSSLTALVLINFNGGDFRARPIYIQRSLGRFVLRRIYTADTEDGPNGEPLAWTRKQFLAVRGHANLSDFLGYSTGEVIYAGPAAAYSFSVNGTRRLIMDYLFQTDDWKFFNDGYLPEGRTSELIAGSVQRSGLFYSSLFEMGAGVNFPTQSDFDGFLT